jgi:hypothetical protein
MCLPFAGTGDAIWRFNSFPYIVKISKEQGKEEQLSLLKSQSLAAFLTSIAHVNDP